jgi:methylmalonyl-CoA mutase C-terminal domain/subunit
VLVFGGGIIPADDVTKLEAEGVERIFTPGANTQDIAAWLRERLSQRAST